MRSLIRLPYITFLFFSALSSRAEPQEEDSFSQCMERAERCGQKVCPSEEEVGICQEQKAYQECAKIRDRCYSLPDAPAFQSKIPTIGRRFFFVQAMKENGQTNKGSLLSKNGQGAE